MGNSDVTLETLMEQAGYTASVYLKDAVKYIDELLGEGYAKKHPELVSSFIQACTKDFDMGVKVHLYGDLIDVSREFIYALDKLVEQNNQNLEDKKEFMIKFQESFETFSDSMNTLAIGVDHYLSKKD